MKDRNICKLPVQCLHSSLTISNFIYETNHTTMATMVTLSTHKAILVCSGSGIFQFNGIPTGAKIGDLLFGFQGETFTVQPDDSCEYFYISFEGSRCTHIFDRFSIGLQSRLFSGLEGLIPLWKDSLSLACEQALDLAAEGILLYTISRLDTESVKRHGLIDKVLELTNAHFTSPDLSIAMLSEMLSYNPKYLSHLFKTEVGINYSEYLRNMRLQFAVSLFNSGLDSVKNVALLSGFSDPLYFSSVFKKEIGLSPKEYLKSHSKQA